MPGWTPRELGNYGEVALQFPGKALMVEQRGRQELVSQARAQRFARGLIMGERDCYVGIFFHAPCHILTVVRYPPLKFDTLRVYRVTLEAIQYVTDSIRIAERALISR